MSRRSPASGRSLLGALPLLLPLLFAPAALAQQPSSPENLQLAQALYDQAVKEMAAKTYDKACPKLEEAVRLVPEGVGAKLTLAECYEDAGRLASAWTAYSLAAAAAQNANQKDRQKLAEERAAALKPKLAMWTVSVPAVIENLPGVVIERDGVQIGAAQWGLPLPADRGRHVVAVTATGRQRAEKVVEIEDGASVVVEAPAPLAVPPAVSVTATATVTAAPTATVTVPPPGGSSPRRTAGFVAMGAGALGLIGGAIAGGMALSLRDQSNTNGCNAENDHCVAGKEGVGLRRQSLTAGNVSTALFIGGGVVAAGGLVLWLTAPSPGGVAQGREQRSGAALRIGPASLTVEGQF